MQQNSIRSEGFLEQPVGRSSETKCSLGVVSKSGTFLFSWEFDGQSAHSVALCPGISSALSGVFVLGVWPEGSDGTDINAACRAHEKKLLSTGDDFGKVHLFSYPCSQFRVKAHLLL